MGASWTAEEMDDVKERTSLPMPQLLTVASHRNDWKRIAAEPSLISPRRLSEGAELIRLSEIILVLKDFQKVTFHSVCSVLQSLD